MKEGDKLYCKKNYEFLTANRFTIGKLRLWFIKDKMYEIHLNHKTNTPYLIDEEGDKNDVILTRYFEEYFYTEKELRKHKLEKLKYENKSESNM